MAYGKYSKKCNCIICNKEITVDYENENNMYSSVILNAATAVVHGGYGSKFDTQELLAIICDKCTLDKLKKGKFYQTRFDFSESDSWLDIGCINNDED